jgi:hypothetical protein
MSDLELTSVLRACAVAGIEAGRAVRDTVQALALEERVARTPSLIKPRLRELTRNVDNVADMAAIRVLEALSARIGHRIELLIDASTGAIHSVGTAAGPRVVFAYLDAVDGTIKLGGLGNDLAAGRVRCANDGAWAAALAFTAPTDASLDQIRIADFTVAAVVEGNPTRYRAYPQEVVTVPELGRLVTFDVTGVPSWDTLTPPAPRVFTSSNTDLSQGMAYFDSFQAFDRETRRDGDGELAAEVYRWLLDRQSGGSFDVLRQYANLSALLHVMLGWRDDPIWFESQGAGFIVINENLANLIPAVPIVIGAGGIAVDFDGHPLAERRLVDGRVNVLYAANEHVCRALRARIDGARVSLAASDSSPSGRG